MKFAHTFHEILEREGYPPAWVDAAIPYAQLKKSLKKVQRELQSYGLDKSTIERLIQPTTDLSHHDDTKSAARYKLVTDHTQPLKSKLSIYLNLQDGKIVDAALSDTTRALLEKISIEQQASQEAGSTTLKPYSIAYQARLEDDSANNTPKTLARQALPGSQTERIEIPLVFDSQFFSTLQSDISGLDALQDAEQQKLETDIIELGQDISSLTKPSKYSKSDLSRWRQIFELYLDARIFFSSQERDHGSRSSDVALRQLVWFQKEVGDRSIVKNLKLPDSRQAYTRFLALNAALLQNLKFQEINRMALQKILKKFDKRTSLGASSAFPAAVGSQRFLSQNVAKSMCAEIAKEVISVVPRVEDYLCPICLSIAWLPVRLTCTHLFCVRCIIKMQRDKKRHCPMCRSDTIMQADMNSVDKNLEKFLQIYFKKETREKQLANETERGVELFGESYKHSSCTIM